MTGLCPIGEAKTQTSKINFYPNNQINNNVPTPISIVAKPPIPIKQNT